MTAKPRPAETAAATIGTGGVVASIVTHNWLALAFSAAHFVPVGVTFIVSHGGVKGLLGSFWGSKK